MEIDGNGLKLIVPLKRQLSQTINFNESLQISINFNINFVSLCYVPIPVVN